MPLSPAPKANDQGLIPIPIISESESEWALLARYVYAYKESVIATEAPQCNRMTATGQDTVNKRTIYKYANGNV